MGKPHTAPFWGQTHHSDAFYDDGGSTFPLTFFLNDDGIPQPKFVGMPVFVWESDVVVYYYFMLAFRQYSVDAMPI